jgi:4-diphosphocytidyl-2-C-methyl-D-erythritol kinase
VPVARTLRARTNAKVNLFLRVLGRRSDGYHEIVTILHGIGLADDMRLTPSDDELEVAMRPEGGLGRNLPPSHENLAYRAARALIDRTGRDEGMVIVITKRIPIGAGLGGGSANAAGALVLGNEALSGSLGTEELVEIAAGVGSDVPYFVRGGTARATARGEVVEQLPVARSLWFVLGMSRRPLLTRTVYDQVDSGASPQPDPEAMIGALALGDPQEVASSLHNDLEPAALALRPELERSKAELVAAGALGALVSGSGPTVFGIARDRAHARSIAAAAQRAFDRIAVTSSRTLCVERLP